MNNEQMHAKIAVLNYCDICESPIPFAGNITLANKKVNLCSSFECRRIMEQKSTMPSFLFNAQVQLQKNHYQQLRLQEEERLALIEVLKDKEQKENNEVVQSVLAAHPDLAEENILTLGVPRGHTQLEPLAPQRIEKYTQHLKTAIKEAAELNDINDIKSDPNVDSLNILQSVEHRFANNAHLKRVSEQLCIMCKGSCCNSGKDHAYISVWVMRRFMDANPELSEEDVLNVYLSRLHTESVVGGCINQGELGCVLPRELRSTICNSFFCAPLKMLQAKIEEREAPVPTVVIQRANAYSNIIEPDIKNDIVEVALIDEDSFPLLDIASNSGEH